MKELPISSSLLGIIGGSAKHWMKLFVSKDVLGIRERFTLDYKVEIDKFINPTVPGMFMWSNFTVTFPSFFRDDTP